MKVGDYKFASFYDIPTSADTSFMNNGVSLTIGKYSTRNIMRYHYFDYDKIYQDVLNIADSYLKVTGIELVCNNCYLVKGEFATKMMEYTESSETAEQVEVKNGKFQFLLR